MVRRDLSHREIDGEPLATLDDVTAAVGSVRQDVDAMKGRVDKLEHPGPPDSGKVK